MYPNRRDFFSFNLNLDLLTLALESLYFNTLDLEKEQGKSLGCIKSRGDTSPAYCTPTLQGATTEGWKSRMRLASRRLPTPGPEGPSIVQGSPAEGQRVKLIEVDPALSNRLK